MSCEQFKAGIREAAAQNGSHWGEDHPTSQVRPPRKAAATTALQAHLDGCVLCRESYADEQSLFAAIDGELARAANGDVRPSFLPRVRAAIEVERAAGGAVRSRLVLWPAACAMAVVCLAVVIFQRVHWQRQVTQPFAASASKPSSTEKALTSEIASQAAVLQRQPIRKALQVTRSPHGFVATTGNQKHEAQHLEVLVPPDERLALARFVVVLQRQHETAVALTKPAPAAASADLASEPLEIAELKVEPLSPPQDE